MSILYAIFMVYIAGEYCGPGFLLLKKSDPIIIKKKKKREELKNEEDSRQIDRQIDRWMKK